MFSKVHYPSLFWDLDRNVPLLERPEEGNYIVVKATPPRDIRPLMGADIEITANAIKEELNDTKALDFLLPSNEVILLNKIPYVDSGDEIIVEGRIVGHRFYDPVDRVWRFKPLYEGVARILDNEVGDFAIVRLPKLTRGYTIHRGDIVKANFEYKKGKFVAISTENGKYHAVAKVIRGSRLFVVKAWRSIKPSYINRRSSLQDVIKANSHRLNILVNKAKLIMQDVIEKYDGSPVVSFSGGKDSLVVLDIAYNMLGVERVIFNDTGLELPETIRTVEEIASFFNIDIITASAGDAFFKALPKMGPPARDYRWCCKICKLRPIAQAYKREIRGPVISLVGQRKYESFARAHSPIVSRSRWIPSNIVVAPINDWTALDVWLYIFNKGLIPNELYFKGLDRVGCWLCPACELAEYEIVKKLHPDLWNPWEKYLSKWAKEHNLPKAWVYYGGWRWLKIPGDFRRFMQQTHVDTSSFDIPRYSIDIHILKKDKNRIALKIKPFNVNYFLRFAPILGDTTFSHNIVITLNEGFIYIIPSENKVIIQSHSELSYDLLYNALSVLLRSQLCVGCGLCELWCPNSAIKLLEDNLPYVDRNKCRSCYLCNGRCFISKRIVPDMMNRIGLSAGGEK